MKKPSPKNVALDYVVNLGLYFGVFVLMGAVVMQRPVFEAVAYSLFMATGFLFFDLLLGSPDDPRKQAQKCMRLLAGVKIEGSKERFSQTVIVGLTFISSAGVTAILLQLLYGDQLWTWIVSAAAGVGVTVLATTLIRRNLKRRTIS